MISFLTGKIIDTDDRSLTVLAGSVGYRLFCPQSLLIGYSIGDQADIWTELIHREGSIELFGFKDKQSRKFFRLLTSISGIGPRSALGILDHNSTEDLRLAIAQGDITYLTKVSGIGRKTAEKILLELKDKVDKGTEEEAFDSNQSADLIDALTSMGYSLAQARNVARNIDSSLSLPEKIKHSLQLLNQ